MDSGLRHLNQLPSSVATTSLLRCCGSVRWAATLADSRPIGSIGELRRLAASIWWSLEADDWLEAFSAHPRIGESPVSAKQEKDWSQAEQHGARESTDQVSRMLADGNRTYEKRFGFIFLICATGKSATEMLSALEERLENDPLVELRVAAEEQMKITLLRLDKLLAELEQNA